MLDASQVSWARSGEAGWPACKKIGGAELWISLRSTAERLFPGAQFHRYAKDARTVIRSPLPYLLDRELADHVDFGRGLRGVLRWLKWGLSSDVLLGGPHL